MNGAERIAAERKRQIEAEGWTPKHDDEHEDGSLAMAAVCYAATGPVYVQESSAERVVVFREAWPSSWGDDWDKRPCDRSGRLARADRIPVEKRIRCLEKAGALIAAEIDRLLRVEEARHG